MTFSGNQGNSGGAILGNAIELSGNGSVTFSENAATNDGGAIAGVAIELSGNLGVTFSGNQGNYGGAICGVGNITLSGNESVTFSGNQGNSGGAICGDSSSTITLSNNESVVFEGNSGGATGGAIFGGGTVQLSDNGIVTFSGNQGNSGGAIAGVAIELSGNESVTFSENSAADIGGAIYGDTITLSGNESVTFSGNNGTYGSAIRGNAIELSGNGSVTFSENHSTYGGAIYTDGNLSIQNNGAALFKKNAIVLDGSYCLMSISATGAGVVSISAAEGKSVEFGDSIYIDIGSGRTVNLNADFTDSTGNTIKQKGDIIFTGATTEADLLSVKGCVGTEKEILNSRTSEVHALTNLYGGRLCVEDDAVYKGYGITAHDGSEATIRVKDATLSHTGYDITLNASTTLELEGCSTVMASNLVMQQGSNLHFVLGEENGENAALTLTGTFQLNGGVNLSFDLNFDVTIGVYKLVSLSGSELLDWSQLTVVEGSGSGYNFTLNSDKTGLSLEILWTQMELPQTEGALTLSGVTCGQMIVADTYSYDSISVTRGCYSLVGSGSVGVSGLLSVSGGAELTMDVDTTAMVVEVGDDSSLSLRKRLDLNGDASENSKAISVGRNAELSLTDAALLGQVATADETSAVYYQTEAGDKLLKFTGEMGSAGLNLALGEDGKTVSATDSAGFTGNITVLSGTTLVNGAATTTDGVPFGANYATAPDKTITVQGGATLDINGRETYYHLVLEKDALLTNSGTDTHKDWKGIPVLSLDGDAEVNADAMICMVGGNYAGTYLNLNGHTLTKTGDAQLLLRNTQVNAGTLAIDDGVVRFMGNTSTASGTHVQVNNGGTLWIMEGTSPYAGTMQIAAGGHVYVGEGPSGILGGDNDTDNQSMNLAGLSEVALAGGTLTFRGTSLSLNSVKVTADSVLEIWDQSGSSGISAEASTIASLDMAANLNLATTWKSTLNIASLTGEGDLLVGSSRQKHVVEIGDTSAYAGTFTIRGASSTLSLNLGSDVVLDAARVTKDDASTLVLTGTGSYNIGTARALAAGVTFAEDWQGSVRLTGTLAGDTLSGLSGADSWVELYGVSGYLSRADAQTGAQTYAANLKLTDAGETAAWDLNNGYKGDIRTFTGKISGEGTLLRSSYKGTDQTLIFTGDVSEWRGSLKHEPNASKNSGAVVKTDVTFSGSSEINVAMRTNGKGELNVTIDDEHLSAGSKVNINNAVSATNFTVTEGTAARLNSTLQLSGIAELQAAASLELGSVVTLAAGTEAATMETVSVSDSEIRGTAAISAIRNMQMREMNGDYVIGNVEMHAVDISGSNATLTLANVNLDDTCSINLGSAGSVGFDDSTLGITMTALPLAATEALHVDCSTLLQSCAYGNLELNFNYTAEEMYMRGYQTLSVEFGAAGDYSNLELSLSNAEFKGFVGSIAQFALAPEPATTTLSLLALSALAARRRRR